MFQFQMDKFQYPAHLLPNVNVYIVDAFNLPPRATMDELRAAGKIMVCAFRWVPTMSCSHCSVPVVVCTEEWWMYKH
jgi:hypothetical protein